MEKNCPQCNMTDQVVKHYSKKNNIVLNICKRCIRPFVHKIRTNNHDANEQVHSLGKFMPFLGQMGSDRSTLKQDHFASLYRIALRFIEHVHTEYEILFSHGHSPADTIKRIMGLVQRLHKSGKIRVHGNSPLILALDRHQLVYSSLRNELDLGQRIAHLQTLQFLNNPWTDDLNFKKSIEDLLDHDRNRVIQDNSG